MRYWNDRWTEQSNLKFIVNWRSQSWLQSMKFSKSITAKRMTTKLLDHINHIMISLMTATSQLYWYVPYLSNNFSVIWSFEEFLIWLYVYLPQSLKVLHVLWSIFKIWQNIYRILCRLHKHYKVLISKFHVKRNNHELCWLNTITLGAWIFRTKQNVFSNFICWAIPFMMV